jgi:NTE family protein
MHATNHRGFPLPQIILLASGGIRVLSYVGALEVLERAGSLRAVHTWAGVSGGALIATAMALGYSINEMRQICERFDFGILKQITEESPLRLLEGAYGLDSGETLARFVRALAHVKGIPEEITFRDLAARAEPAQQPALRIWAADLDAGALRCFSAATTPEFPVLTALRASMTIPLVYDPVVGPSGEFLVDGAVFNSFPMHSLTADERTVTLGITTKNGATVVTPCPRGFSGYLKNCLTIAFEYRSSPLVELFRDSVVVIDVQGIAATDFSLSADQRGAMTAAGRKAALKFLRDFKGVRARTLQKRRMSI